MVTFNSCPEYVFLNLLTDLHSPVQSRVLSSLSYVFPTLECLEFQTDVIWQINVIDMAFHQSVFGFLATL
jgi:hypothetical protein